jgi:hypothetical protein
MLSKIKRKFKKAKKIWKIRKYESILIEHGFKHDRKVLDHYRYLKDCPPSDLAGLFVGLKRFEQIDEIRYI